MPRVRVYLGTSSAWFGDVTLRDCFVFRGKSLWPHVPYRLPINDGYPHVFVRGILHDPFHLQFLAVEGEGQTVSQDNLLLRQIFHGPNAVQAQTAVCIRIMEVGKDFWMVHGSPPVLMPPAWGWEWWE